MIYLNQIEKNDKKIKKIICFISFELSIQINLNYEYILFIKLSKPFKCLFINIKRIVSK